MDHLSNISHTVSKVDELRVDALYGKKKHFNAADRKQNYELWLGIPAITLNVIGGSLLFGMAIKDFPTVFGWIGAVLVLISTFLTTIQTFLHFQRQADGHKRIANRYLEIAKECGRMKAYIYDGLCTSEKIKEQLEILSKSYAQVNLDAESYPTNQMDYKKAQQDFVEEESYRFDEIGHKGE